MYLNFDEDYYLTLETFLQEHAGTDLATFAIRAWGELMGETGKPEDEFVVIKVHGYFAIAKITDEWIPIEISTLVQPFDENKVYPLQRIKKEITWD